VNTPEAAAPVQSLPVYTLTAPERTSAEIEAAYAEIQPVTYTPPAGRWRHLQRTARILAGQGNPVLRVVMLGDSIIGDTGRSEWDMVLQRSYSTCRINKVTVIRGSTGCWWYRAENRVQVFVYPHRPDLLIIGGISQSDDVDAIRDTIRQARALHPCDVLLLTPAFGIVDPRCDDQWTFEIPADTTHYRYRLRELADSEGAGFLDMTAHWGCAIRASGRELDWFKRDGIHANARGEQILGRILAAHLAPPVEVCRDAQGG
jgi:lysophospholipase L1-like esterase